MGVHLGVRPFAVGRRLLPYADFFVHLSGQNLPLTATVALILEAAKVVKLMKGSVFSPAKGVAAFSWYMHMPAGTAELRRNGCVRSSG